MRVKTEVDTCDSYREATLIVESNNDDDNVTLSIGHMSITVRREELEQGMEPHFFNAAAEAREEEA